MAGLRVMNLHRPGLGPVSLEVGPAETLAIHGPSGSGKTLLLRAIADLDPNTGEVSLDGHGRSAMSAPEWRRRVMYLPPVPHWWEDRVGPHAPSWPAALLQALGFDETVLEWEVRRLSSGERQRLSLARALARRPQALLLDEPTANLDPDNTLVVEQVIAAYQRQHATPVLWVSHDAAQRARVASHEGRMNRGRLQ